MLTSASFVIGSSWQLKQLSVDERDFLDRAPFVLVCNRFPEHWRKVGFRPTLWAMGDTDGPEGCAVLKEQLTAIRQDSELRERLRHLWVCCESPQAHSIVAECELPVTLYRRGNWTHRDQQLATIPDETIYHFGSTLTNLVNLALILNPGREVRITGCQHGRRCGHFYDDGQESVHALTTFGYVVQRMWQAFADLQRRGTRIVDCNFEHEELPGEFRLPRRGLLE